MDYGGEIFYCDSQTNWIPSSMADDWSDVERKLGRDTVDISRDRNGSCAPGFVVHTDSPRCEPSSSPLYDLVHRVPSKTTTRSRDVGGLGRVVQKCSNTEIDPESKREMPYDHPSLRIENAIIVID